MISRASCGVLFPGFCALVNVGFDFRLGPTLSAAMSKPRSAVVVPLLYIDVPWCAAKTGSVLPIVVCLPSGSEDPVSKVWFGDAALGANSSTTLTCASAGVTGLPSASCLFPEDDWLGYLDGCLGGGGPLGFVLGETASAAMGGLAGAFRGRLGLGFGTTTLSASSKLCYVVLLCCEASRPSWPA